MSARKTTKTRRPCSCWHCIAGAEKMRLIRERMAKTQDAELSVFARIQPITSVAPMEAEDYESSALTTELTAHLYESKTYER